MATIDQQFVEYIVKTLVNNPDKVAVERKIDEKYSTDTYIRVLKHYSDVGKAIVTCIGDIGRNDIIRE